MSEWIYKQTESQLWTVGHYDGENKFHPESDHGSPDEAREHIRILNGGKPADCDLTKYLDQIEILIRDMTELRLNIAQIVSHLGLAGTTEADIDAALRQD